MFITFEGMEGCGKTTQIQKLKDFFSSQNQQTVCTREPGGSELGRELRKILLHPKNSDLCSTAELFLYLADRAQHIRTVIQPALKEKKIVISDRFADSTIVYQGYGRGLDTNTLITLNEQAVHGLCPDLTFLLDLEPEEGLRRANSRDMAANRQHLESRFEMEAMAFHKRVREGYLHWAGLHPDRFVVINARPEPDQVYNQIRRALQPFLTISPQP